MSSLCTVYIFSNLKYSFQFKNLPARKCCSELLLFPTFFLYFISLSLFSQAEVKRSVNVISKNILNKMSAKPCHLSLPILVLSPCTTLHSSELSEVSEVSLAHRSLYCAPPEVFIMEAGHLYRMFLKTYEGSNTFFLL
jgi:hypothetical protein